MAKLTVDYFSIDEIKGGVQTFFSDFRRIYPDFREISFLKSLYSLHGKLFHAPIGAISEFEKSNVINRYIEKYEKIFTPDIIVKNSVVCTPFKHKAPMICTIQDNNVIGPKMLYDLGYYDEPSYDRMTGFLTMQMLTMKNSDAIVASSEHLKSCYEKMTDKEIILIKNGVDNDLFKPMGNISETKKKYGIPDGMKVGISTTDFHPIKGFHIISKMCHSFPDIFWILVMKHPNDEKPRLKNVKILSSLPREQLPELYNVADFFILPSAIEGCNVAAIEAMSCDKPVIVSNTGYFWNPEMTKEFEPEGFGIRVNKWNANPYVDAVNHMLANIDSFSPRKYAINDGLDFIHFSDLWKKTIKETINNAKDNE